MPKNHRAFPCTLNFGVDLATKQRLVAVGYLQKMGGEYAAPARNFIDRAFGDWYRGLSEHDRKVYDEILKNVEIEVTK